MVHEPSYVDWYGFDLTNPRKIEKLIKKLEQIIRKCPEYKIWADYCRRGHYICPKCNTSKEIDPLEVHHAPKTLFEIVFDVVQKHIDDDSILKLKPIDIINEVLCLHLDNKVSYEILCSSCHERFHNEEKLKRKTKVAR